MTALPNFWTADRDAYTQPWVDVYWTSQDKPHRLLLVQEMARLHPASVLEVGCHCGVNLRLLAQAMPGIQLSGMDVSREAIEQGRQRLAQCGVEADLRYGKAPEDLATYLTDSVEWVLSCYALAYLTQPDARKAMAEMWRISTQGIVMFEPTAFHQDQCEMCHCDVYRDETGVGDPIARFEEWRHPLVHFCLWEPTMVGALATVIETSFSDAPRLNALIVVQR